MRTTTSAIACSILLLVCVDSFAPPTIVRNSRHASTLLFDAADDNDGTTTLEICMSPGCLADGAQDTLQKLQALIPEDGTVQVQKGVCCSLCGNGPVVMNGNQKIRKVSTSDKITKLLQEVQGDDFTSPSKRSQMILESFDLIDQARSAAKARNFGKAVELFQEAVDLGTEQVTEAHSIRQVEYLIQACQDQTKSYMQMPGKEAKENAIAAAQRSVDFMSAANDNDETEDAIMLRYSSLECLQEAMETFSKSVPKPPQDMLQRELAALQELLGLEPAKLTTQQQNKRRSLGFRLQKLEKDVK